MSIPHGVRINLPTVVGRQTFTAQRSAAILRFLEATYRIQIDVTAMLADATRRHERGVLSDLLMRIADPHICTALYENGITQDTRNDIIMNVNEMHGIASRPNTRRMVESGSREAIQRMIHAYEDLAYEM